MKTRFLLLLTSIVCVLVVGFFIVRWATRSPINRNTFERIVEGMTLKEVDEVIGLPPGEYGTKWRRVKVLPEATESFWDLAHEKRYVFWSSNDGEIIVLVSLEGRVIGKMFYELEGGPSESTLEIIRRWFGL